MSNNISEKTAKKMTSYREVVSQAIADGISEAKIKTDLEEYGKKLGDVWEVVGETRRERWERKHEGRFA